MLRRWLRLLLIPILLLAGGAAFSRSAPKPYPHVQRAIAIRTDMWDRLNAERVARGLKPLTWNGKLSDAGLVWSRHMRNQRGISHSALSRFSTYSYMGETVGSGSKGTTSRDLHVAFMNSPDHRDIFLSPGFTSAGIGVYCGPYHGLWVTYTFGRTLAQGSPPAYSGGTSPLPLMRGDPSGLRC